MGELGTSPQARRRHRAKLHFLARGRADALVSLAERYGWPPSRIRDARMALGLDLDDYRAAVDRHNAYRVDR